MARLKVGADLPVLRNAQTRSRDYTASWSKGTMRTLGKKGRRVKLFTRVHLVPRLLTSTPNSLSYTCTGTNNFTFVPTAATRYSQWKQHCCHQNVGEIFTIRHDILSQILDLLDLRSNSDRECHVTMITNKKLSITEQNTIISYSLHSSWRLSNISQNITKGSWQSPIGISTAIVSQSCPIF